MILSKLASSVLQRAAIHSAAGVRSIGTSVPKLSSALDDGNYKWKQQFLRTIGNREQVGYGWNGQPCYEDLSLFPFPSIRYKEWTPELKALHEKEKGDWKELSMEEKKCLYRASFCQTFAEFQAPTGEWKTVVGCSLILVAMGLWLNLFMFHFVYSQLPVPITFEDDRFRANVRRQLDLHMGPVLGIASEWDYDCGDWKEPNKFMQLPNPYINPCTGEKECNNYRGE